MPELSARAGGGGAGAIMTQTSRARALRAAGHDVVTLTVGEPDFSTPPHAVAAAHAAALAGETKYPPVEGTRALREAAARAFGRDGIAVPPERVLVTNGGKQAIFGALLATLEPGDEVVILAPYWGAYPLMVRAAGGVPVVVTCRAEDGFRPDPAAIAQVITRRTKWIVLNFPGNPSGVVLTRAEVLALAEVFRGADVWMMADDMYARLGYDRPHVALAAVAPDLADRVLTVSGVSKTYAMTGWRIGFCAGPAELIAAMAVVQAHMTAGVSTVGQAAAAAALDGPQDFLAGVVATYGERRDFLAGALAEMRGVTTHRPEGAFYAFPGIGGCVGRVSPGGVAIGSDTDFCAALLEEAHVAIVPGAAFGMSPHARISFACDMASLRDGMARMAGFCAGLR